jgi:hypothetical protein
MNDEFEIIFEGSGRGLIEVLSRNFPEGTEENHENSHPRYVTFSIVNCL